MKWVRDGEGRSGIGRIVLITNLRRWFRETGISRAEGRGRRGTIQRRNDFSLS
jgi:hypothetical protein